MTHSDKVKLAKSMRTHQDILQGRGIFETVAWRIRKEQIQLRILKRLKRRQESKPVVYIG